MKPNESRDSRSTPAPSSPRSTRARISRTLIQRDRSANVESNATCTPRSGWRSAFDNARSNTSTARRCRTASRAGSYSVATLDRARSGARSPNLGGGRARAARPAHVPPPRGSDAGARSMSLRRRASPGCIAAIRLDHPVGSALRWAQRCHRPQNAATRAWGRRVAEVVREEQRRCFSVRRHVSRRSLLFFVRRACHDRLGDQAHVRHDALLARDEQARSGFAPFTGVAIATGAVVRSLLLSYEAIIGNFDYRIHAEQSLDAVAAGVA